MQVHIQNQIQKFNKLIIFVKIKEIIKFNKHTVEISKERSLHIINILIWLVLLIEDYIQG